jgi:hypothetical protein
MYLHEEDASQAERRIPMSHAQPRFPKPSGPKLWPIVSFVVIGLVFASALIPAQVAWATPPQQGGGGTVPSEEEEEEATPTPTDLTRIDKVPWTAGPNGGKLDLEYGPQGCLLIDVPPGALEEEILFEVAARPADQAPPDTCTCGDAQAVGLCKTGTTYTVDGWYRQRGQPVGHDLLPGEYVHTICYTEADLVLAGGDPHNFVIAYYDDTSASWLTIPTSLDSANRNVSGVTNHMSWWALMVKKPCSPPLMPVTGGGREAPGGTPWGMGLLLLLAGFGLGRELVKSRLRRWRS